MSEARVKVIYIVGYGRSGSTILDIVLSQASEVFGGGELTALSRHVWNEDEFCACGERIRSCPIWRAIFARWADGEAPEFLERYHALQRRHENLAAPYLPRRVDRGFAEYRRHTVRLFRAISDETGKAVVLDSSKLPGRAYALSRMPEIDLFVLHLVRDGRAVAWSMMHPYEIDLKAGLQKAIRPKSAIRTALRWTMVNAVAEKVCIEAAHSARTSYEEFVFAPEATLRDLGEKTGIAFDPVAEAVSGGEAIRPGHQMAGSRIRMKPSMVLSSDDKWRVKMPRGRRAQVEAVSGRMLRRYGFRQ